MSMDPSLAFLFRSLADIWKRFVAYRAVHLTLFHPYWLGLGLG
jgi:hypothetical protein